MQGRGTGRSPRRLRRRCGLRPQKPPCRAVWAAPRLPPAGTCPDEIRPSVPLGEGSLPAGTCPFPARRAFRLRRNRGRPAAGPYACLRQTALRARPLHQLSPTQKAAPLPGTAGQRGGLPWPHPYFLGKVLFTHGTSTQESTAVITISGSM